MIQIGLGVDQWFSSIALRLMLRNLKARELFEAYRAIDRLIAAIFMLVNISWQEFSPAEITRSGFWTLTNMNVEEVSSWKFPFATPALRRYVTLPFMSIDLLNWILVLAEPTSSRPGATSLMSVNVLWWKAIPAPLTRF